MGNNHLLASFIISIEHLKYNHSHFLVSNFLDILPLDCLLNIAGFLPIHERFKGMSVCKQWREILSDQQFWTNIGTPLLIFFTSIFCTSISFHFFEIDS